MWPVRSWRWERDRRGYVGYNGDECHYLYHLVYTCLCVCEEILCMTSYKAECSYIPITCADMWLAAYCMIEDAVRIGAGGSFLPS